MRSVYDAVKAVVAVRPHTMNATGTPIAAAISEVDTFGYSSCMFDFAVGSPTGTSTSYTFTLVVQESATSGGTVATITGATGTVTGTSTSATLRVQIRVEGLGTSRSRYLKLLPTLSTLGQAGALIPISGVALLGRAFQEPVGNDADQIV